MPQPIRVAVLGYGLAGRVFHCPFVSAVPGLELAAIVQRKGDEAGRAYPHARILRSAEEAFADPAIDLIVVGTPNETHATLAAAALQAGKHVVVDKPMAPTGADILHLMELAKGAGKVLAPFQNRRWDGDFLTLKQLFKEGKLGRLVKVISHWDRFRPLPRGGSWKESAGDGNGLLQDLGPHLMDQAMALFGPPQRLTASVRTDREGSAIEDAFDIVLEYGRPNGTTLLYECRSTMIAADPAPRFRVHGTGGSFTKYGLDPQEDYLVSGGGNPPQLGSDAHWVAEPESAWGTLTLAPDPGAPTQLEISSYPTLPGDYRLFYAGVRDAIRGTAPLPVTAEDGWRVARLIELARESSRERRTLDVDLVLPASA